MNQNGACVETVAVAFQHISKSFGAVVANDDITFQARRGAFHALLGENGAGKTTLMRMLAGELVPDAGEILVNGEQCRFRSPRSARARGIRMVHQHSILIPNLSIAENFLLDATEDRQIPNMTALCAKIRFEADKFGIPLDPRRAVWELSTTQRQWLEAFRALFSGGQILILDEPTALLSLLEGDALLDRLKALTAQGISIILITHKMREVFKFADTVTVLRKGRWITTEAVRGVTEEHLAAMMVAANSSRERVGVQRRPVKRSSSKLIAVDGLSCNDHRGRRVLTSVGFVLSRGEILGVAGVSGNGQDELARIVAGVEGGFSGSIEQSPVRGLVRRYIPEDRIGVGTAATLSVRDNLTLRDFQLPPCSNWGLLDRSVIDKQASSRVSLFQIKTPSTTIPVSLLSGGNIQRVVVARELAGDPDVVVAHNPTAGLDVATAAFVRDRLVDVAARGGGVLLISDDLDELIDVADRIVVLHAGEVAGVLGRSQFDRVVLAGLMSGATHRSIGAMDPGP
jgi:general nucleoside transport system ATP-binding protein